MKHNTCSGYTCQVFPSIKMILLIRWWWWIAFLHPEENITCTLTYKCEMNMNLAFTRSSFIALVIMLVHKMAIYRTTCTGHIFFHTESNSLHCVISRVARLTIAQSEIKPWTSHTQCKIVNPYWNWIHYSYLL